jgi:hypothetical protein
VNRREFDVKDENAADPVTLRSSGIAVRGFIVKTEYLQFFWMDVMK